MLIALFFALFAVALLFYAIGIGHAVLFREKFQDAADAAALSSAVMHARAMNLIVLINLVMAAILSVLVTIKLVESLCVIGIVVAFGAAFATFGATLASIPPLQAIDSTMDSQFEAVREPIFNALKCLHDFAGMVRDNAPGIAASLSVADIAANATLPDIKGAAVGSREKLPVEDDTFPDLCGRAIKLPLALAESMLGFLPREVWNKYYAPVIGGVETVVAQYAKIISRFAPVVVLCVASEAQPVMNARATTVRQERMIFFIICLLFGCFINHARLGHQLVIGYGV